MHTNPKLTYAISAILGTTSTGLSLTAHAADATDSEGIQEVTVTAQRRTENLQDVPITVQAMTSETLQQLNVTTLDDFIKYLPNVTQASNGPGQSAVYMRGLSIGSGGSQSTGTNGQIPNVAVYLDD
jgi:outer membrane receptor protein involved in Fe transport